MFTYISESKIRRVIPVLAWVLAVIVDFFVAVEASSLDFFFFLDGRAGSEGRFRLVFLVDGLIVKVSST